MKAKPLTAFLMESEQKFLSSQYDLIIGVINYYVYYKSFEEVFSVEYINNLGIPYEDARDFLTIRNNLGNACYDKIITNWCGVFGTDNEETHHKKLTRPGDTLRKEVYRIFKIKEETLSPEILRRAGITEDAFSTYHAEIIPYRNNLVSHRTGKEVLRHPSLAIALKTAFAYYSILRELLENFDTPTDERHWRLEWFNTFASLDEMLKDGRLGFKDFLRTIKASKDKL